MKSDDPPPGASDLTIRLKIDQLRSSDQAPSVTARRAKRENGGLGEDPPGSPMTLSPRGPNGGGSPQESSIANQRAKRAFKRTPSNDTMVLNYAKTKLQYPEE
jgi:hypothetical protein